MKRLLCLLLIVLASCAPPKTAADADDAKATATPVAQRVAVRTAPLAARTTTDSSEGVAAVLTADTLIQQDGEIKLALLTAANSRAIAIRQRALFRDDVTVSRQTAELAEQQAATDELGVQAAQARLANAWGPGAPFARASQRASLLRQMIAGELALVRVDLPDSAGANPKSLQVISQGGATRRLVQSVWPAPGGNSATPGMSYFGLIRATAGLRPGDRAAAVAALSGARTAIFLPASAITLKAGAPWCFVETSPGTYTRVAVSLDRPEGDGYLVTQGLRPGQQVVIEGAGELLARETAPAGAGD